jgi:hypothetical protein
MGGSLNSDDPYGERSDRTRLLAGTEVLSDGSRRIAESTSIALETETHGADILRTLVGQREQIENSRNTVGFFFVYSLRMMVDPSISCKLQMCLSAKRQVQLK